MSAILQSNFYYLDNFQRVLDWIAERYADLLTEEERSFITIFPTLPQSARALFVRMTMRKGTLFRVSKLKYPEIGCPMAAASAIPAAWIEHDPTLSLDELFELSLKPELIRTFSAARPLKVVRKLEMLEALRLELGNAEARSFSSWMPDEHDCAMRLTAQPLCDRLRLMFFGSLSQDWSEFVLADLGMFRYETIEFSPTERGFQTRADIEHYLRLHACKERYYAGEAAADILSELIAVLPPGGFENPWLESRRERLMFQLGQLFEKEKNWKRAHEVYADCRYPGARGRAIRVLEKDGKYEPAYDLLQVAQQAPESDAERQHLLRIGPRLGRLLGHPASPRRRKSAVERLDLELPAIAEMRVEAVIRDHLHRSDAPVLYVENALVNALFGLLCWSAVFAAIPGAFFHPFHRGPTDLLSSDFHARRRQEFDACLARLDDGSYYDTILATYDAKNGLQSPFVAWGWVDRDTIALALECIPSQHLKLWCQRILSDVRANRAGFPDLIQFWPQEKRYRMIEVKGPGDRLQDNQLRWIDYFTQHEMPVTVCYLQWAQAA